MPYSQTDLATLSAAISSRGGDGGVYWVSDERTNAINEAICVWQALTGMDVDSIFPIDASTGSGVNFFAIPRQIVSPQRLTYNGAELTLISEWELDNGFPGWEGVVATPTSPPLYWTPIGFCEVAIYPAPTSGTIIFEGITEADLLHNTGDFIDVGAEELTKFLLYAHYYLTIKEGGAELDAGKANVTNFMDAAGYMNGRLKEMNFYKRALGLIRDDNEKPRASTPSAGARLS